MKIQAAFFLATFVFHVSHPAMAEPENLRGRALKKPDKDDDDDVEAPQPPEEDEQLPPPNQDDDSAQDTQEVSKLLGLSLSDAQLLLQQQKEFSEVVASLEEDNNFMQAEMPSVPNGEFVVKYKNGNIPQKSKSKIDEFKVKNNKAKVKEVATKRSLKGAESRGDRLTKQLEKQGYTHIGYAIDGDDLELTAKNNEKHDKNDKGKIPPGRAAEILELNENDEDLTELSLVLTEFDGEDPIQEYHTYGGRKINGNLYQCTTGFSVINSSGVTGVSTAGHCTGMNWYDAVPPEADYATYFQRQHVGDWGDMEWHYTTHAEPAEYYAYSNVKWPVRSIASSISKGEVVCGYSRRKGARSCDRVYRTSVSQGSTKRLVAMEHDFMVKGDSGGPWSYYDKAYGIVTGAKVICDSSFLWIEWDCHWRDTWTRAMYFGPGMGVQVRTQ